MNQSYILDESSWRRGGSVVDGGSGLAGGTCGGDLLGVSGVLACAAVDSMKVGSLI